MAAQALWGPRAGRHGGARRRRIVGPGATRARRSAAPFHPFRCPMHGVRALRRLAEIFGMAAMLAGIAPAWGQSRALSATPTCHLEVLGTGRVQAVVDGRSFVLEDGREIRLPGIEVPLPPLPGETGARAEAGAAARAALEVMVAGQTVELRHELAAADRYGRILAHAYFAADGKESSAALEMIAAGFARVSAHVGGMQCAAELLGREREARQRKVGLWGEAYYSIVGAENHAGLVAQRGQFTVAEGKVVTGRGRAAEKPREPARARAWVDGGSQRTAHRGHPAGADRDR